MKKYYVVFVGRKTGIFETWDECKNYTHSFKGAIYKSYLDLDTAQKAYSEFKQDRPKKYLTVDVGCRLNGDTEYKLVLIDGETTKEIYASPVYQKGTNNIGEFLALVHGMRWVEKHNLDIPVYTDSKTALAWVRDKRVNTSLKSPKSSLIMIEVTKALEYLQKPHNVTCLKWQTNIWGEIPADYGRK